MQKVCNFDYLRSLSPDNPQFISEMVTLFLAEIPIAIDEMDRCLDNKNWTGLSNIIHKSRPTLDFLGLQPGHRANALQIEEYIHLNTNLDVIPQMVNDLQNVLRKACKEMEDELVQNMFEN